MKNYTFGILSISLLLSSGFLIDCYYEITKPQERNSSTKIIVTNNETLSDTCIGLEKVGIAKNYIYARVAIQYLKLIGYKSTPGEYKIGKKYTLLDAIKKLCSGDVIVHNIVIFRGQTKVSIIDMLNKRNDLLGEITVDLSEGDILAGKYEFVHPTTKNDIIVQMKKSKQQILNDLWKTRTSECILNSSEEVICLASIVAREAMKVNDIKFVASVFLNRLKANMRLQSCAVSIYYLTNGTFDGIRHLKLKDRFVDIPGNTYKNVGLPPKPICSPSVIDIEAVTNPIKSSYFYFSSNPDSPDLHFSNTHDEHCAYKRKFKKVWEKIR